MHRKAIGGSLNHWHVGNCFLLVSQKIVSRRYRCHFPVMVFSIMTSLHNKDQVVLKSWNESARWAQASTQYDMRTLDFCLPCGLVQQVGFSGSSSKEESPNCQYTFEDLFGILDVSSLVCADPRLQTSADLVEGLPISPGGWCYGFSAVRCHQDAAHLRGYRLRWV